MNVAPLTIAKSRLYEIVRSAVGPVTLARRGHPVAMLVPIAKWQTLQERIQDLGDEVAIHAHTDLDLEPGESLWATYPGLGRGPDPEEDVDGGYLVLLCEEARAHLAGESARTRHAICLRLAKLSRNPRPSWSRPIGALENARRMDVHRRRIAWRIDGDTVSVVRIAYASLQNGGG